MNVVRNAVSCDVQCDLFNASVALLCDLKFQNAVQKFLCTLLVSPDGRVHFSFMHITFGKLPALWFTKLSYIAFVID